MIMTMRIPSAMNVLPVGLGMTLQKVLTLGTKR